MNPVWCMSGFAGLFILIGVWLQLRRRRLTRALLTGGAWVHWQYDTATWLQFTQQDAQQARGTSERPLNRILVILSIIPIAGAFGALIGLLSGNAWGVMVVLAELGSIVVACVLIVLGAVSVINHLGARRLAQRRTRAPSDVYINRDGVWESGRYQEFYSDIEVALLDGAPPMLEFRGYTQNKGFRQLAQTVRVPVPPGKDTEAHALIARFQPQPPASHI